MSRQVGVLLFDGFELLDVFGPVELWSRLSDRYEVTFCAVEPGPVRSSQGAAVMVTEDMDASADHDDAEDHADEHGHSHDGVDPHAWLDPENGKAWTRAIAAELARLDPANAAAYATNADAALAEIDAAAADTRAALAPLAPALDPARTPVPGVVA